MRWNVAIAATGRCKRVCTGSAARSVERGALPWTCFANREPKAEIKPLGRYTRHVGDTHDTESLLQCLDEVVVFLKRLMGWRAALDCPLRKEARARAGCVRRGLERALRVVQ